MTELDAFTRLTEYVKCLHGDLFVENFETVSLQELFYAVQHLTRLLNETLKYYHTLDSIEVKTDLKPMLKYVQDLLEQMVRLLKFEPKDLTKHNQILLDLEKMLLSQEELVCTKYRRIAENEYQALTDENLKEVLEKFVEDFMKKNPDFI